MDLIREAAEQVRQLALLAAEEAEDQLDRWSWARRAMLLPSLLHGQLDRAEENRKLGCSYNYRGYGVGCVFTAELHDRDQLALTGDLDQTAYRFADGWNSMNRDRSHRICAEKVAHDTVEVWQAAYLSMILWRAKNQRHRPQDPQDRTVLPCEATCMSMLLDSPLMDDYTICVRTNEDASVFQVDFWAKLRERVYKLSSGELVHTA
ncbi:MAG: hypothetical protein Q8Q32_02220 [bacterium]|nr:hypothetical protein [bacterium]